MDLARGHPSDHGDRFLRQKCLLLPSILDPVLKLEGENGSMRERERERNQRVMIAVQDGLKTTVLLSSSISPPPMQPRARADPDGGCVTLCAMFRAAAVSPRSRPARVRPQMETAKPSNLTRNCDRRRERRDVRTMFLHPVQ